MKEDKIKEMKERLNTKGQVLIVVMLIMIVVSLIVLGVASRSITNLKISSTQENSARAFAAAETGVEEAIQKIKTNPNTAISGGNPLSNGASYRYTAVPVGGTTADYLSATPISRDTQAFQVYLSDPQTGATTYTGGSICIMWESNATEASAIEANLISKDGSTWVTNRYVFDTSAGNSGRIPTQSPELQGGSASGCNATGNGVESTNNNLGVQKTFGHYLGLTFPPSLSHKLLRIRLLFAGPRYFGVRPVGNVLLPQQGWTIDSTGTLTDGTTRRVKVFQSYPALPGIFDYVLFNGAGDLSK